MGVVQTFDSSMIENYLRTRNLRYSIDMDGDYRVDFSYDDDVGGELTYWLVRGGQDKDVYQILVMSTRRIPKPEWGLAVMLCNTWNTEKRWPKAYLYIRDNSAETAEIRLDQSIDLETGVHQELLDDFTNTMTSGAIQFWMWAHKEKGL